MTVKKGGLMDDLISRKAAIDAMEQAKEQYFDRKVIIGKMQDIVNNLPSAQLEMIREIRKWINSGNRGNADYFIVEKIEEIINKYE